MNPQIAAIYQDFFPNDNVVVGDAHQYLLDHFSEFDFIWSSPPCHTHSRCNNFLHHQGIIRYPDMILWQEIIFLKKWFKGKYCVENVISYYEPLIKPQAVGRHYFWSNFRIGDFPQPKDGIGKMHNQGTKGKQGHDRPVIERNKLNSYLGLHILNESKRDIQPQLFRKESHG